MSKRGKALVLGGTAIALVVLIWAAWPDAPATTREANIQEFGLADDPFLGDPDAPMVLVGYESPHCSSCQYFHNNLLPSLDQEFFQPGKVVYRYIQGTIGGDFESSIAQECAYREGGNEVFWDLTARLYARSYTYSSPDWDAWLNDLATDHGLDAPALTTCYHDQETSSKVRQDLRVGSDHGVQGTPTFWIFGAEGKAQQVSMSGLQAQLRAMTS